MKKISVLFLCMFALLANIACADKRKALQVSDLPKEAQKFINENFSSAKVVLVKGEAPQNLITSQPYNLITSQPYNLITS